MADDTHTSWFLLAYASYDSKRAARRGPPMQAQAASLDDYVEAFEQAWRSARDVDLKAFLPPAGDPLYAPVLRELVRIDLELGWESNRPRSLEDYRERFPELFRDPESLQQVAFEEYRLRRQAGQAPTPEEYASRYGVRTDGWPVTSDEALVSIRIEAMARSYRDFRLGATSSLDLASWRPPSAVGEEAARLFRELHGPPPRA